MSNTVLKRVQVSITWLLLVLAARLDSGLTRSLKPRSSVWKMPLKAEENPLYREPPGVMFRWKIDNPLDSDPKKLHKIIKKFEPRYMSVEKPNETEAEQVFSRREIFARMPEELKNLHFIVPGSDRELGSRASKKLRLWLSNLSSCKVLPLWRDFGETIWPRYVNIGQCEMKNTCSYPKGMQCKPAKYKRISVLFWVCGEVIRIQEGTRCKWAPFPVDVIEACKCSC